MTRSLYECFNARVKGKQIYCRKGHHLPNSSLGPLRRGDPMEYKICQDCADFSRMGKPVASIHRGWKEQT
jgi:hypothetical protein